MSSPTGSPFAEVIQSLAGLHQEHHKALMDMRADQERRFCALVQNQREDRELLRSWMDREVRAGESSTTPAPPTHMPVQKMGPQDDPEAFIDLFEKTAAACGWPQTDWPVRLIPLLTGEAQLAAQQLPVQNLLVYEDLKRAILQRVGRSPEQHRQRFRSLELGENGRPFVMAHQLRDACRRWLLAGEGGVDEIIDQVVLEQFIARLPKRTAQWVQCHRPASLDLAIQLAEDQMVACHGVGEPLPSVSLSLPLPFCLAPYFSPQVPCWRGSPSPAPMEGRAGPGVDGRKSPQQGGRVGWPEPRCWSRFLSLSTSIPCPSSRHWGGGEAWAGLLALRGPGPFYRSVSGDGGGDPGPGSGRQAGRPRSGWRVPDTCEYEGGYVLGVGGFGL